MKASGLHKRATFHTPQLCYPPALRQVIYRIVSDQVSRQVSEGNYLAFKSVAPVYGAMIEQFAGATRFDQRASERFVSTLKPDPAIDGGRDLLRSAVRNYHKAMFEMDSPRRAELILLPDGPLHHVM